MAMRLTDLCPVTITMNFMPAIAAKLGNCLGKGNCQSTATATVTAGSRATGYWETRSSFLLLEQHWQYIWAIKISFPTIRLYGLAQYNVPHIHVHTYVCMYVWECFTRLTRCCHRRCHCHCQWQWQWGCLAGIIIIMSSGAADGAGGAGAVLATYASLGCI